MAYEIKILPQENWPPLLREINDPPKKLFYAGKIPNYENKFLCVVGSRKYTNYGREAVAAIISELQGFPITIVSGLALGIDSIAHRMALKHNIETIAVPGSGLDPKALHPSSHISLAKEITESVGALISEYEPSFKATQWSFPLRNRIMAGMSHATLIIEAEEKSGTMITGRFTTEYNRDLLATPGSIFSPASDGPNKLIRLGATLVRGADDVLEALGIGKLNLESKIKNQEANGLLCKNYDDCSEKELILISFLKEPLERDELIRKSVQNQISVSETQTFLTLLELKGHITEKLGQIRLI